jgi:glutamate N-acetyltransferase/amino-acid N-acetyltransferase
MLISQMFGLCQGADMDEAMISGFSAAGVAAGIKKKSKKELGLIVSERPATVAGVFTRNRVQAAPVVVSRECVSRGTCRALIVNSGNANCCTGARGLADARQMAQLAADALGVAADEVLVASTGVIGEPLPVARISAALPSLMQALSPHGFGDLAEAIMTTDTVSKLVYERVENDQGAYSMIGVAKGAGMIHPDMATMLAFVCSDADIEAPLLQQMLRAGVSRTFNRITIDGDTSTNDMAILMANGMSGVEIRGDGVQRLFQTTLDKVLGDLAKALVRDGEGATKLVEIVVCGAATATEAHQVANTVATSPLVKTALFGEDANWGRILAAAGRSGVPFDPEKLEIRFDQVTMYAHGAGQGKAVEAQATAVLKQPAYTITIDLGQGSASDRMFTCDLSVDYIRINADYRT